MCFRKIAVVGVAIVAFLPGALAGFNPASKGNVAVYWGQNSGLGQQRLVEYCKDANIDVTPISFLTSLNSIGSESLNFANQGDLHQVAEDITTCQAQYGKTITLSVGGQTYNEGGFENADMAIAAANQVWDTFGPTGKTENRPFGSAVVDGLDIDIEDTFKNGVPFGQQLRKRLDESRAATGKPFMLSAAPQCPYPDLNNVEMMAKGAVGFDAIFVQFYNNPACQTTSFIEGASEQTGFNMATWDRWAKEQSVNPNVKIFLGVPAHVGGAGQGYVEGTQLKAAIDYSKQFESFGGVMAWDASQAYKNDGFLSTVRGYVGGPPPAVKPATPFLKPARVLAPEVEPLPTPPVAPAPSVVSAVPVSSAQPVVSAQPTISDIPVASMAPESQDFPELKVPAGTPLPRPAVASVNVAHEVASVPKSFDYHNDGPTTLIQVSKPTSVPEGAEFFEEESFVRGPPAGFDDEEITFNRITKPAVTPKTGKGDNDVETILVYNEIRGGYDMKPKNVVKDEMENRAKTSDGTKMAVGVSGALAAVVAWAVFCL